MKTLDKRWHLVPKGTIKKGPGAIYHALVMKGIPQYEAWQIAYPPPPKEKCMNKKKSRIHPDLGAVFVEIKISLNRDGATTISEYAELDTSVDPSTTKEIVVFLKYHLNKALSNTKAVLNK